jgi:NAD(P)-dependent dehydrogenase (short-subunit alcohol dehydrogenase family)
LPSDPAEEALLAAAREVTGHPARLLVPAADLERDLGMRPAACVEVLRRACARLGRPVAAPPEPPRGCRTFGDLAALLGAAPARPAAPPPGARLDGRVALVTGSGHGLGRVLARRLAALGAAVVVNSFHSRTKGEETAAELRAAGHDAVHVWGSVAQGPHLDEIFRAVEERFGVLHIFVNNASNGFIGPLDRTTPELWERGYRTNVVALHQGALRAARLMTRGGRILTITSPGAEGCFELFATQGTIKAAVEALARYLAVELAPRGIAVNAVSAGPILGERLQSYPDSERLIAEWHARSVEGRICSEEDVAAFIARFLADPAAEALSGSRLLIDGGTSAIAPGLVLGAPRATA